MSYSYRGTDPAFLKKVVYKCKTKGCKVEVISKVDHRAILGREHAKHCPRSKKQ